MNYLAHLFLAENNPGSIVGSLLGDFVKGPLGNDFSKEILEGIVTHRKIDSFTDSHSIVIESKKLINQPRRRYAGIIVDVSFDHFLAKNWSDYSNEGLSAFIERVNRVLIDHIHLLPEKLKLIIPRMVAEDWLGTYKTVEGIGSILDRISGRLTNGNKMSGAVSELEFNYEKLEQNFKVFLPELMAFVEVFRNDNSGLPF